MLGNKSFVFWLWWRVCWFFLSPCIIVVSTTSHYAPELVFQDLKLNYSEFNLDFMHVCKVFCVTAFEQMLRETLYAHFQVHDIILHYFYLFTCFNSQKHIPAFPTCLRQGM